MENINLTNNFTYNGPSNFSFLVDTIKQQGTWNMPLLESLCIVEEA